MEKLGMNTPKSLANVFVFLKTDLVFFFPVYECKINGL